MGGAALAVEGGTARLAALVRVFDDIDVRCEKR